MLEHRSDDSLGVASIVGLHSSSAAESTLNTALTFFLPLDTPELNSDYDAVNDESAAL